MAQWWILLILFLTSRLPTRTSADSPFVSIVLSATNEPQSSDGNFAVYLNEIINVTVNIQVSVVGISDRNFSIQIKLPTQTNSESTCRQWYDGGPPQDLCTVATKYNPYAILSASITNGVFTVNSKNLLTNIVPPMYNTSINTLVFELKNSSAIQSPINIGMMHQIISRQASDIGVTQSINASIVVKSSKSSDSYSAVRKFKILGPKMELKRSSSPSIGTAGQTLTGSLILQQDSYSSSNPKNVLVKISASDKTFCRISSASGTGIKFSNSVAEISLLGPILVTDVINYNLSVEISKNAPLGLIIYLSYTLSWEDVSGKTYTFPEIKLYWGYIKAPIINAPVLTNCDKLTFETLCKVAVNIKMATGVLANLSFWADFDSSASSMNKMPVEIYESLIQSPLEIQVSDQNRIRLTNKDFLNPQRRKRRAAGQQVTVFRPNVTLANPESSDITVTLETSFIVSSDGLNGNGQVLIRFSLSYFTTIIWLLDWTPVLVTVPVLKIQKNFGQLKMGPFNQFPQFTTMLTVENVASSGAALAYKVLILDSYNYTILMPKPSATISSSRLNYVTYYDVNNTTLTNQIFTYLPVLQIGEIANLSYTVAFKEYMNLNKSEILRPWPSFVSYYTSNNGISLPTGLVHPQLKINVTMGCLFHNVTLVDMIVPNVEQILLSVFLGLIFGFVFVILIVLLVWCVRQYGARRRKVLLRQIRKQRFLLSTSPLQQGEEIVVKMNKSRDTSHYIKVGKTQASNSIFAVLIRTNKNRIVHGLQRKHLEEALTADKELEGRQEQLMIDATTHLIKSVEARNIAEPNLVQNVLGKFHQGVEKLNIAHKAELKQQLKDLKVELSAANKIAITRLNMQFKNQKDLLDDLENISRKERAEFESQLKLEQTAIYEQMIQDLLIDQETALEEARKREVIKKRHQLCEVAQKAVDKITRAINNDEIAKQLLSEHYQLQTQLAFAQSCEISRQRGYLDLRLERHREQLASQEFAANLSDTSHMTLRNQNRRMLRNLEKKHLLSHKIAHRLLRKAKRNEKSIHKKCRDKQMNLEEEMKSKLEDEYKAQLASYIAEKEARRKQFQKEQLVNEANLSTAQFVEKMCEFQSAEAQKWEQFEEEWENHEMEHLTNIRKRVDANIQTLLEKELSSTADYLKQKCTVPEYNVDKIISSFSRKRSLLSDEQASQQKERSEKLQIELERRRQMKFEREAGLLAADIHEHHFADQLSLILMEKHGALSLEEKERILRDHETNMEKLQNSLALGRLQQQQQLNQRLADKRLRNREILEQRQQIEIRTTLASPPTLLATHGSKRHSSSDESSNDDSENQHTDVDYDVDVEESDEKKRHRAWLNLLHRQQKDRLSVLDVENDTVDEVSAQIEEEILHQRQDLLERQQEQFATQLAQLQINKAKEIARIEEQQLCISQLKMGLVDDLTSRGLIGNDACKEILDTHKQQEAALLVKLNALRQQQEQNLHQKLQKKQEKRQLEVQSQQMMELKQQVDSGMAARLRRAILKQKHMLENEKLKQRADVEAKQMFNELVRFTEMKKLELLANQELEIVASLTELGKFSQAELRQVLISLFPLKSNEEIDNLLDEFDFSENAQKNSQNNSQLLEKTQRLKEITKSAINRGQVTADFISKLHARRNKTVNQLEAENKYSRPVGHLSSESLASNNTHVLTPLSIAGDTEETYA